MPNRRSATSSCSIFLLLAIPVVAQTLVESNPAVFDAGGSASIIGNLAPLAAPTPINPLTMNPNLIGGGIGFGLASLPGGQPQYLSNSTFVELTARGAQQLAGELAYDEQEIIGASALFGPATWKTLPITLPTRMPSGAWPARRARSNGQIAPNFGLHPWSVVHAMALRTPDSPGEPNPLTNGVSRAGSAIVDADASSTSEHANTAMPTGQDFYEDMKEVIAQLKQLRRDQANQASGARDVPSLNESYERVLSLVRNTSSEPLTSLAARGGGPSEQYARSAERYVRNGEFYRAVSHYRIAQAADPANPLLYLGEATAAIGAGEHFTAVRKIERGLALFPEIAYFKLDLNAFVTDPQVLDVRRADLETRLAEREDYRFRFLLGFIEYYSGLEEFGLENLKRAAADAPSGSAIAQFPTSLRVGRVLLEAAELPATRSSMR